MRTSTLTAFAALLILTLAAPAAQAKGNKGNKGNKEKAATGTIVSVAGDGGSLVFQGGGKKGGGGQKTITINASTRIQIDSVSGKHAADLHGGMQASIKVTNGYATEITVGKHKKKKGT